MKAELTPQLLGGRLFVVLSAEDSTEQELLTRLGSGSAEVQISGSWAPKGGGRTEHYATLVLVEGPRWVTKREMAATLSVSVGTFERHVMPHIERRRVNGKQWEYSMASLNEWIEANTVPPMVSQTPAPSGTEFGTGATYP